MPALLELIVPIHTTDPEAAVVQTVVALVEPHVLGGAIVETTGYGEYGETDLVRVCVRGYVEDNSANLRQLSELVATLTSQQEAPLFGEVVVRPLADADWTEAWKDHFQPIRVGQRLIITPTWAEPDTRPDDIVIRLDPGLAFGTGGHPSTRLILRLLERHVHIGDHVLDVGTGSGILAIAAIKLGAAAVHATDNDPVAVRVAAENLTLNDVADRVSLETGSVPGAGHYEIVVANILADVIAELLLDDGLADRVSGHGTLLLAGIIHHRRHFVDLALAALGLRVIEEEREGDWIGLAVRTS